MMTKQEHYLGLLIALACFATQSAAAQWIRQAPNPTGNNLSGVAMLTAQHGFLSTSTLEQEDSGSLFETFDGGATWTQRDVSTSNGDFLNGIFFLDDQLGWGFGNDNFRTTVIPPEGGTFQYIVTVENNSTTSQSLDLWFTIATPNNREIPRGPFSLNLAPGASFTRTLSQKIPRGAPAGSYTLTASAGTFPDEAEESDSFSFEKLPGAPEKPLR